MYKKADFIENILVISIEKDQIRTVFGFRFHSQVSNRTKIILV